jgi:lysophospholipase L1-like esterase
MKTILCYGDSNTWGYNPRGGRYDHTIRWPMVMASLLNGNSGALPGAVPGTGGADAVSYWVVEEGLNGRTTCLEDPVEGDRNGLRQIIPILKSHKPLDLVILMLGTNDLKHRFNPSAYEVSQGAQLAAKAVFGSEAGPEDSAPRVLLVCPPPLTDASTFRQILADNALELSGKLPAYYRACAKECGAAFFDAGTVVKSSSPADGLHWETEDHRNFAGAMAEQVKNLLG